MGEVVVSPMSSEQFLLFEFVLLLLLGLDVLVLLELILNGSLDVSQLVQEPDHLTLLLVSEVLGEQVPVDDQGSVA